MAGDDELHEDLRPRHDNPEGISRFEIAARTWAAQERIIKTAHALTEHYDLDPPLVEDLEDAHRRQDSEDWDTAVLRFMEALAQAKGVE